MKFSLSLRYIFTLLLLLISGCTSYSYHPKITVLHDDLPFSIEGRLAVKIEQKGNYGNFTWQHLKGHDEIEISTPVGSTVAKIIRDESGVRLIANGKEIVSDDAESLTKKTLGYPLPLDNLIWWVRGKVAPDLPYTLDKAGILQQQGWRISFFYEKNDNAVPSRVDLVRGNLSIKIVSHS